MAAIDRHNSGDDLKSYFEEGWKLFRDVENNDGATNSKELQHKVNCCMKSLSDATRLVNVISLYSRNEDLDEISSSNLRYLLLPAFMGEVSLLQMSNDRLMDVSKAKIYFIDFLQRCKDYSIADVDLSSFLEEEGSTANQSSQKLESNRQEKVNRYRQTKELKEKILSLEERLKDSPDSVEDEVQREYYLSWIRLWVNESMDKLSIIKSEIEILKHMEKIKSGKVKVEEKPKMREPIKPILITKDSIRSKVFGAGYPSLPTMTPEQWMDKQIADGKVVLDYNPNVNSVPAEESDDEEETDEKLAKARAWDDWKDEHRRGEGNRKDRG